MADDYSGSDYGSMEGWDASQAGFTNQDWANETGNQGLSYSENAGTQLPQTMNRPGVRGDGSDPNAGNLDAFGRPFDPNAQAAYEAQHPETYGYGGGGYNHPQHAWNLNPLAAMNGAMNALGNLWNPVGASNSVAMQAAYGGGGYGGGGGGYGGGHHGYHSGGGGAHATYAQYLRGRKDLMYGYSDKVDALGQDMVSRGLSNSTADVPRRLELARAENADLMSYDQSVAGPYQAALQAGRDVPALYKSYGDKLNADLVARGLGSANDPNLDLGLAREQLGSLDDAGIGYRATVLPKDQIAGYRDILQA
jgi:hypothetical protein